MFQAPLDPPESLAPRDWPELQEYEGCKVRTGSVEDQERLDLLDQPDLEDLG